MFKVYRVLIWFGAHGKAHTEAMDRIYKRLHEMGLGE